MSCLQNPIKGYVDGCPFHSYNPFSSPRRLPERMASMLPLSEYELERNVYQASKLGFLELELKHSPSLVHRQSGWSKFWAALRRFFDKAVEEGVDR